MYIYICVWFHVYIYIYYVIGKTNPTAPMINADLMRSLRSRIFLSSSTKEPPATSAKGSSTREKLSFLTAKSLDFTGKN